MDEQKFLRSGRLPGVGGGGWLQDTGVAVCSLNLSNEAAPISQNPVRQERKWKLKESQVLQVCFHLSLLLSLLPSVDFFWSLMGRRKAVNTTISTLCQKRCKRTAAYSHTKQLQSNIIQGFCTKSNIKTFMKDI